ncbi:hypothetical protein [Paraglaciecola arctica]|uniref:hypothetical protein n=1 Tax=Paraglaciecola arctica TaxID=1128911 RepID=UPI001C0745BE|nr:hypothetical protein [Paraglaciecola arctica]MBU3002138.1 hypothetical protein [Paraglaciecola arctica]
MKHKIALVHGMGQHKENWSNAIQTQIKQQYAELQSVFTKDFDELFEFVEIRYDNVFDEQRARWKSQADDVLENLKIGGISSGGLEQIVKATQSLGEDNFFTTHILDVVLYKWYPLIAEEVRLNVAKSFLDIAKTTTDWSIIVHSLGTAVVHDTLQAMFTQSVEEELLPRVYRPSNIWMIANVSRVVSENQVYRSLVKPTLNIAYGLCEEYFNAQHEFDPIPMVKPFQSDKADAVIWKEEAGGLYLHLPIKGKNTTQINVHAFDHYLAIPSLFVPMMRSFAGRNSIDKTNLANFIAQYESTTVEGQAQSLKLKLEQINPKDMSSIEEFLKALREYYEFLTTIAAD